MITGARNITSIQARHLYLGVPVALYVLIAVTVLRDTIPWTSVNFVIGIAGLPVAIAGSRQGARSWRMLPVAVVCAALCFVMPYRTMLFAALFAAAVYLYEQMRGRLSLIPLAIIVLMSPMAQYFTVMFSFPIRLWLTRAAGSTMSMAGLDAEVAGNVITMHGHEYSVDPACMGLKMLLTSLLCGLLLIAVMQKRYGKYLRWQYMPMILVVVFVLNLVANLFRILTLVYFDIAAGTAMHEVTGLAYLGVYVLLPVALLVSFLVRRYGMIHTPVDSSEQPATTTMLLQHAGIAGLLLAASFAHKDEAGKQHTALPAIAGYEAMYYDKDVRRYSNKDVLVYIKQTNGLLGAEHNPAMCWLGAGYAFACINEEEVGSMTVYTAHLLKGKEMLYTAWWYDNGTAVTTSQLVWRWDMLNGGKPYSIINITTATQELLYEQIKQIRAQNVFKAAL